MQDTTLSQPASASLCIISYDVRFHVQSGTEIFFTVLSIQTFKSFDLCAEINVNNLYARKRTNAPITRSVY
jgi:predicted ATP-grasp superfamily ATP-dependent carboligase